MGIKTLLSYTQCNPLMIVLYHIHIIFTVYHKDNGNPPRKEPYDMRNEKKIQTLKKYWQPNYQWYRLHIVGKNISALVSEEMLIFFMNLVYEFLFRCSCIIIFLLLFASAHLIINNNQNNLKPVFRYLK